MNRETRKALKESIAHWYRISACETKEELCREGFSNQTCALCERHYACIDCPVAIKAGESGCFGTPYYKAAFSLRKWLETSEWYNTDQANIEAEIRFLESLLED